MDSTAREIVKIPDRGRRKGEITRAFWRLIPSSSEEEVYEKALDQIGVTTVQDIEILISIVNDAIMKADREGLSAEQLLAFRNWLLVKRLEG